ncbi:hypothetical protein CK203_014527 [Vitis vinifera]|uniref:Uncharacterized protein n=1 Tax=Vitis vinifera TaxID=29760 RepID=A0A438K591_VITVI|nr:hypothetical protein CK203_014527 [Vitis vinifera]
MSTSPSSNPPPAATPVRAHVGDAAEELIYLFCVVPRQPLIHDDLLFRYSDDELVEHLKASEVSVRNAKEGGVFNGDEAWRKKVNSPCSSWWGYGEAHQDWTPCLTILMAALEFSGNSYGALWPGDGKPGLWLNSISRMGAVYSLLVREEEIFIEERKRVGGDQVVKGRDEELELVIPPVLGELHEEPICGEPHVVLAQIYLTNGRFEEAEREAEKGLKLMLEWGNPWDKRMTWEGWIAWNRVLLMKAKERSWPNTSWGILNLGLVK